MSIHGQKEAKMKSIEKVQLLVILLLFWYIYWIGNPRVKDREIKPRLSDQFNEKPRNYVSDEKENEGQSSITKPQNQKQNQKPKQDSKAIPKSKPKPKPGPKPTSKEDPKLNPKPKPKPDQKSKPKEDQKLMQKPKPKPDPQPKPKEDPKPIKNQPSISEQAPKPKPKNKSNLKHSPSKVHALIMAYMRTGSTYFGQLLGQYNQTFYHYEPLHYYSSRGNNWTKFSDEFAINLIQNIYNCQFHTPEMSEFVSNHSLSMGMAVQLPYFKNNCINRRNCSDPIIQTKLCKESEVTLIKTVRLRSWALKTLMKQDSKLKVILLVRDPRSLINSRKLGFCGKDM